MWLDCQLTICSGMVLSESEFGSVVDTIVSLACQLMASCSELQVDHGVTVYWEGCWALLLWKS